jgi:CubicO group peptidase (beta-lactamase class C family)
MKKLLTILTLTILCLPAIGQPARLRSFIDDYAKKHQFNGTVLIQKNSETIYHKSFGLANREFNVPFTNRTKYKVCSVTKSFTAVLILQLYEQGKIDLNKKIGDYLPGYRGEARDKVSIHQLLNHTSGMLNTDTVKSMANAVKYGVGLYQKPFTSDQLIPNFCSYPLAREPGTKFDYNNGEYMILGKILEAVYKKPYRQILNEQILLPLAMHNSGLLNQDDLTVNLASSYFMRSDLKHLVPDLPVYYQDWYAAGAMYSTTTDLLKFFNALFDLKLIKKQSLDLMLKPGLDGYGYSVWIRDATGANIRYKRMERYGSIMGANAAVFRYLNENLTIVILSNTNLTDLGDFALKTGKQIF